MITIYFYLLFELLVGLPKFSSVQFRDHFCQTRTRTYYPRGELNLNLNWTYPKIKHDREWVFGVGNECRVSGVSLWAREWCWGLGNVLVRVAEGHGHDTLSLCCTSAARPSGEACQYLTALFKLLHKQWAHQYFQNMTAFGHSLTCNISYPPVACFSPIHAVYCMFMHSACM